MKFVMGLGNPGSQYQNTRHNIGFKIIEELAGESDWKESKSANALYTWIDLGGKVELFAPQTFMNKSGTAVAKAVKKHPKLTGDNIYVIHDDLDIPLGKFKIQFGKGPREHKGIQSIETSFGSTDFWRVRVGVDGRIGGQAEMSGEEYVLKAFKPDEKDILEEIIKEIITSLTKHIKDQARKLKTEN